MTSAVVRHALLKLVPATEYEHHDGQIPPDTGTLPWPRKPTLAPNRFLRGRAL